ncbi:TolC family protein [Weeksella virosa]|uniref:Outer membrane efflux protein n=1 Tax=Weeksella virosa (strain ATCC 43766 / DSM 16922 / JCM 21250 / CCUG 30538 / CDC 9751 / IAM 14551 / NBRC 16016 / NCTC 11634 / CL345/78) TaxID=865938 RepID=F0P0J8_WEEVC|nr:TolC family protein [Weeksella virosa]ADX68497.1 outer membrane efflux protein [Weeksella virosa DSM 16922]MDK7675332.1 TolC family protein [Weeksella virosa]VEH63846.1 type I secretion outer membrane protein, TolC family [Weeksella virosa]
MTYKLYLLPLLLSVGLQAQELINPQLKKPVIAAIENNYELKNKQLEVQKNDFQILETKGILSPHVNALGGAAYLNASGIVDAPTRHLNIINTDLFDKDKRFNTSSGLAHIGVMGSQVIFSGLQVTNGIKALEAKSLALKDLAESSKEEIAKEVLSTFDQLMLLEQVDKLIENSQERLDKERLKVQRAIQNGLAIPYDREKIKLAMLELESKKVELNGSKRLLYDKLEMLTHLTIDELHTIEYPLQELSIFHQEYDLSQKKELSALQHSKNAVEFLIEKEKGGKLPQVFAFAGVNYTSLFGSKTVLKDITSSGDLTLKLNHFSLFPNFMIGIGAKWDILDGNQHKNKVQQATIDLLLQENKYKDAEEKLKLLLKKNKVDYETSVEKLKVKEQQQVIANQNLEIASKRFQVGLIDVTERLAAENDFYKANLSYYTQLVDQRQYTYDLLQTAGQLLHQILD